MTIKIFLTFLRFSHSSIFSNTNSIQSGKSVVTTQRNLHLGWSKKRRCLKLKERSKLERAISLPWHFLTSEQKPDQCDVLFWWLVHFACKIGYESPHIPQSWMWKQTNGRRVTVLIFTIIVIPIWPSYREHLLWAKYSIRYFICHLITTLWTIIST